MHCIVLQDKPSDICNLHQLNFCLIDAVNVASPTESPEVFSPLK